MLGVVEFVEEIELGLDIVDFVDFVMGDSWLEGILIGVFWILSWVGWIGEFLELVKLLWVRSIGLLLFFILVLFGICCNLFFVSCWRILSLNIFMFLLFMFVLSLFLFFWDVVVFRNLFLGFVKVWGVFMFFLVWIVVLIFLNWFSFFIEMLFK